MPASAARDVYPPRVKTAVMLQNWKTLTFFHWRVEPRVIQHALPSGLSVDTFDGTAWLAVTPFRVTGLQLPHTFPVPWLSEFPETNVRTYVRGPDESEGIWFFSLDAARLMAVAGARILYGLPYHWANMQVSSSACEVEYVSHRRLSNAAASQIRIKAGAQLRTDELARFLTARFRLFAQLRGELAFADVEHEPWPLHEASIVRFSETLRKASGIETLHDDPIVHYSPGVNVRIGPPQKCVGHRS